MAATINTPIRMAPSVPTPPNGSATSLARPKPIATTTMTSRISTANPRMRIQMLELGGGATTLISRSSISCRLDGGSWPSFSIASRSSSGRRSACASAAFIICRSIGRSCGWAAARASLKYLRAASES
jgi:hypothetical protein